MSVAQKISSRLARAIEVVVRRVSVFIHRRIIDVYHLLKVLCMGAPIVLIGSFGHEMWLAPGVGFWLQVVGLGILLGAVVGMSAIVYQAIIGSEAEGSRDAEKVVWVVMILPMFLCILATGVLYDFQSPVLKYLHASWDGLMGRPVTGRTCVAVVEEQRLLGSQPKVQTTFGQDKEHRVGMWIEDVYHTLSHTIVSVAVKTWDDDKQGELQFGTTAYVVDDMGNKVTLVGDCGQYGFLVKSRVLVGKEIYKYQLIFPLISPLAKSLTMRHPQFTDIEVSLDGRDVGSRNKTQSIPSRAEDVISHIEVDSEVQKKAYPDINADRIVPGNVIVTPPPDRESAIVRPIVLQKIEPEYTEEARVAKIAGIVEIAFVVGEDGKAREMRIVRSLGFGLDEKAIEALVKWRFQPGSRNGKSVALDAIVEVKFRLL